MSGKPPPLAKSKILKRGGSTSAHVCAPLDALQNPEWSQQPTEKAAAHKNSHKNEYEKI